MSIDPERLRALNAKPIRSGASYVLYWAQMNRRTVANHALAYAIELANEHNLPVLFYEGLTCSYPHANDRFHTFLLEGVPDTEAELARLGLGYVFYLRRTRQDANDILYRLAAKAAAVVTDDYPTFVAATHNSRVPERVDCSYIAVDSSCVVPMNAMQKQEYAAYTIRPKIQRLLPQFLSPVDAPRVRHRYDMPAPKFHTQVNRADIPGLVASCEIEHGVRPSTAFTGGSHMARVRLQHFLRNSLRRYAREKNEPAARATSNLSPYLHFGHISSLETALATKEYAAKHHLIAEEFLEELIVRRELAFNFARFSKTLTSLEALPEWARKTLAKHRHDRRDPEYTREQMERAETYDALWNATQKELLLRGIIHGYYRMYWGKKIIEWAATPEEALELMIDLHDRYALDGRDPNTYTNILWCFGLHDRPWFERPIFGQIRYMSLEGMKRKTDVNAYIREIDYLERTGHDLLRLDA